MDIEKFFTVGMDTGQALPATHEPALVVASYVIAALAGFAFLRFASRIIELGSSGARYAWVGAGALTMGLGVWAMHFVAMLAYRLPIPVGYEPILTALSALPAVLGSAVALYVAARSTVTIMRLLLGGAFMGAGIGAMHYTGMAAMRFDAFVSYDPLLFATSIVVAVALAFIALSSTLWTMRRGAGGPTLARETVGALIMGLAVSGMHYTAMTSAFCFAEPGLGRGVRALDPEVFAAATTTVAIVVLAMAIAGAIFGRRLSIEIARRQKAALEQRRTELELNAFFTQSPTLMCVISFDGLFQRFNPNWKSALGYGHEELISNRFLNLVHPDDREKAETALEELASSGEMINLDLRLIHKDGSERAVLWNASYDPQELQIYATGHDITALKAMERMKDEFVSTVSHELRTPLTSIKGALGLIRAKVVGALPADMNAMLEIAYKNCDRLVLLINDILDIEKIEAGKMDFNMRSIDLAKVARNAVSANQTYADQFGVMLEFESALEGAVIRADESRIMQVLANLLSNAAKFSPEGSRVQVRVERRERLIRVSVEDHGTGIPEQFRGRIFEKFSQHDSSDRRKVSGTGLGLSIVRAIVERHGGHVDFTSTVGAGTTFFVEFPELVEVPVVVDGARGLWRVLVCEDDPDVATILRQIVERCGHAADVAMSAAEATALLTQHTYAAMTLDIMLPDISGIELFKRLRADPKTSRLPVIFVSAKASESAAKINGCAVNVIDWLSKPFDEERLVNAIQSAIAISLNATRRILYVEDDADLVQVVARQVGTDASIMSAGSLNAARQVLGRERFDLVILDLLLPDGRGEELLPLMQNPNGSAIPVIVFSAAEVPLDIARRVEKVLVKTRSSDQMLINAISSFLAQHQSSPRAAASP